MARKAGIRFGLFQKTLVTTIGIAVIPLAVIWYLNYEGTAQRIAEHVNGRLDQVSGALATYVDSWVDTNYRMLRQNAELPQSISMKSEQQNPILQLITKEYPWVYLAFSVAPDGQNIGRSDGKEPRFYGDRVYVKQVLDGAPTGQQVLIGKTSGEPALVLSVPIRQADEALRGILAIAMTIVDISDKVANSRIGRTGYAYLLDTDGKVIAHQSKEYTKIRKDFSQHPAFVALTQNGRDNLVYDDENGKKIISYMKKTGQGWIMVAQQNYDEAFGELEEANTTALIMLAATMTIVMLLTFFLSRRLSVPIAHLTEAAEFISRGKLDTKIDGTERRDEIGALARAIERLGVSIKMAMERLGRKR